MGVPSTAIWKEKNIFGQQVVAVFLLCDNPFVFKAPIRTSFLNKLLLRPVELGNNSSRCYKSWYGLMLRGTLYAAIDVVNLMHVIKKQDCSVCINTAVKKL